ATRHTAVAGPVWCARLRLARTHLGCSGGRDRREPSGGRAAPARRQSRRCHGPRALRNAARAPRCAVGAAEGTSRSHDPDVFFWHHTGLRKASEAGGARMRNWRTLLVGFLAIVLAGTLAFLYMKTEAIDFKKQSRILSYLRE